MLEEIQANIIITEEISLERPDLLLVEIHSFFPSLLPLPTLNLLSSLTLTGAVSVALIFPWSDDATG